MTDAAVIDDRIQDTDLEPFDATEEQKQVTDIQNKLNGIEAVVEEMNYVGGVKQANIVALENYIPNLITSKRPLKSFTEDYSKNNFQITMENIEAAKPFLIGGLIAAVAFLLYKVIKWIIGFFSGSSGGGGGGGDDKRDYAKEAEEAVTEGKEINAVTEEIVQAAKADNFDEKAVLDKLKKDNPDNEKIQKATSLEQALGTMGKDGVAQPKAEEFKSWNLLAEDILLSQKYMHAVNAIAHELEGRLQGLDNMTKVFLEQTQKAVTKQGNVSSYTIDSPVLKRACQMLSLTVKGDSTKAYADAVKAEIMAARKNENVTNKLDIDFIQKSPALKSEMWVMKPQLIEHWKKLQSRGDEIKKLGETAKDIEADVGQQIRKAVQEINETIIVTADMFAIVGICEKAAKQLAAEIIHKQEEHNKHMARVARGIVSVMEGENKKKFTDKLKNIGGKIFGMGKKKEPATA